MVDEVHMKFRLTVGVVLAAGALLLATAARPATASAATSEGPVVGLVSVAETDVVYPITFPVAAPTYYSDTFGACRDGCTRTHTGIDIMGYGWKGLPVVAAHDGTITLTTESAGRDCCAIWGLTADDGWKTMYIHLNNDTPGTDDGAGWGFAPGIVVGAHVTAGQLIGWVGDSGNAESVAPHLHFELHSPDGTRINPYPSLQAAVKLEVPRVAGADRFATAVDVSNAAYPGGADVAYVTTGFNFPDGLAGGPAAARAGGPILLSRVDSVPSDTMSELRRLSPSRIVILGGEMALSAKVADDLAATGAEIIRLAGSDRYDTAAMISAMHFDPGIDIAFVTDGTDFRTAVVGAPAATGSDAPLLLTRPDRLPSSTRDELERLQPEKIVVLGAADAVGADVEHELARYARSGIVERVAGDDPYGTAAAISAWSHPAGSTVAYVATSGDYADALAGISLASRDRAPILLVGDDMEPEATTELQRLGASSIVILGGPVAVSEWVEMRVWNILNDNAMPVWK